MKFSPRDLPEILYQSNKINLFDDLDLKDFCNQIKDGLIEPGVIDQALIGLLEDAYKKEFTVCGYTGKSPIRK